MIRLDENYDYPRVVDHLSHFSIDLYSGHQQDYLYANGNMQAGVFITIIAVDANQEQVKLYDSILDTIELIKFTDSQKLPEGWSYTSIENDYSHTFPFANDTFKMENFFDLSYRKVPHYKSDEKPPYYQRKLFWVTTNNIDSIRISAKITLDGKTYKTFDQLTLKDHREGSKFTTLVGYPPIIYHAQDLIHIIKKDFNFGEYVVKTDAREKHYKWVQNNYYILPKIKFGNFTIKDITVSETYNDYYTTANNYRCFTHHTKANDLYLWFIWGQERTVKDAGDNHSTKKSIDDFTYEATPKVTIVTTPRTDAVCLSRLYFQSPVHDFWDDWDNASPLFRFTDIYGNKSYLIAIEMQDYENFTMKDWKP
ncbi:hypothetical protein ACP179_02175 (plasmid) [Xenorhabdus stockiae]|uniref:hypothetical protein n=1 Tax=Xenorhabdus stockiae TaxID=351614 RepID=UPI003CEC7560